MIAVKRLFDSCKTRAIGCINSLAATSDSRSLLLRLRGQRFPPAKPWSFVIRDICIPSRSLHRSRDASRRSHGNSEIVLFHFGYPQFSNESRQMNGATTWIASAAPRLLSSLFSPIFVKLIRWRTMLRRKNLYYVAVLCTRGARAYLANKAATSYRKSQRQNCEFSILNTLAVGNYEDQKHR